MITKQKGTYDIYGDLAKKRAYVNDVLAALCEKYNYGYIETPVFEASELFHRGVGESTDMVKKETYDFSDRGERSITLRPEGTAGVVRWFVENKLYEMIKNIFNKNFEINPKIQKDKDDLSCKYCQYSSICYKTIKDYKFL